MSDDALADRRRAAEDDYFRNRDRELIEGMRKRVEREQARQRMSERVESTNEELLDRLEELGFSDETVLLVHLLPFVEMAWADGAVSPAARSRVMNAGRERGVEEPSPAHRQLDGWLTTRPSDALFAEAPRVIAIVLGERSLGEREAYVQAVLDGCTAIASASGGVLGLGKISSAERRVLDRIRGSLRIAVEPQAEAGT
jgi:hypothetical protein